MFQITYLAGDKALVTGNAGQQTILDAEEYLLLKRHIQEKGLVQAYDQTVSEFFKPLTDASEAITAAARDAAKQDPDFILVVKEEVSGVTPVQQEIYQLGHDTVVLKLIEENRTERLLWIGQDRIEILAA